LRFAEHGFDSVAIDYFGRTAGVAKRDDVWDYMPHVHATTLEGVTDDVRAALDHLRSGHADRRVFVVGFCFGGSNAWHMAASDLDLAGAVGFYGHPDRPNFPQGAPSVLSRVTDFSCPVRAFQGGADPSIPSDVNAMFREAMDALEIDGEVVEFRDAPHSFFDRKQDEYAEASADAWKRVLSFLRETN
jgi:carboxymethylenebutenolidase